MNEHHNNPVECWETGSTQPPKSRGGLVAVLLVAVILLCGVSTCLGLLNIRLTLQLHGSKNPNISFSKADPTTTLALPEDPTKSLLSQTLGITGQAVSELEQRFYHLPAGYLITDVHPGSAAAKADIRIGDILLSVGEDNITDEDSLNIALTGLIPGEKVLLVIYRDHEQHTIQLTAE